MSADGEAPVGPERERSEDAGESPSLSFCSSEEPWKPASAHPAEGRRLRALADGGDADASLGDKIGAMRVTPSSLSFLAEYDHCAGPSRAAGAALVSHCACVDGQLYGQRSAPMNRSSVLEGCMDSMVAPSADTTRCVGAW